jgi:hypothetical protein
MPDGAFYDELKPLAMHVYVIEQEAGSKRGAPKRKLETVRGNAQMGSVSAGVVRFWPARA